MLSRALLDIWDPQSRYRDGEAGLTICQVASLPIISIGLLFTLPVDVFIVVFVLRIRREED
jgi:hypothetical protein